MGLRINEKKTMYMKMSPAQVKMGLCDTTIDNFKFEEVDTFTYLGSVLHNGSKMWTHIHSDAMTAKAHNKLFMPELFSPPKC